MVKDMTNVCCRTIEEVEKRLAFKEDVDRQNNPEYYQDYPGSASGWWQGLRREALIALEEEGEAWV